MSWSLVVVIRCETKTSFLEAWMRLRQDGYQEGRMVRLAALSACLATRPAVDTCGQYLSS